MIYRRMMLGPWNSDKKDLQSLGVKGDIIKERIIELGFEKK